MTENESSPSEASHNPQSRRRRRKNRFAKHPKTTIFCILVVFLVLMELSSYVVIVAFGHQRQRGQKQLNRQISGYTVFKNAPNYDMASSTIKVDPSEPDAVLNEFGFLSDQPLALKKKPNTIRIFILGGSAAFGAGQDQHYHAAHLYPGGIYSYPQSIAGHLKRYLKRQEPDVNFEVINAAAYRRQFHQSVMLYLESISRFDPDYVVNIEGWNDIGSFTTGTPYRDAEWMLHSLVELNNKSESWLNHSNTYYLLLTAYDKFRVESTTTRPAVTIGQGEYGRDEYQRRRGQYVENAARFEQILRQYVAALEADNTKLVFVLQPILLRTGVNKRLSSIEKELLDVSPFGDPNAAAFDDQMLIAKYFFDDYLSNQIGKILETEGETFVDANLAMQLIDEKTEFYADYCHLLPEGSRFIGETIGKSILKR